MAEIQPLTKIEEPQVTEQPVSAPVKDVYTVPVKEKPMDTPLEEPLGSDFGLYKCGACEKMVMGFEKLSHQQEKHGGKSVNWKKLR